MNDRCGSAERGFREMQYFRYLSASLGGLSLSLPPSGRGYIVLGLGQLCGENDSQAGSTGGTCTCTVQEAGRRCFGGFVIAGVIGEREEGNGDTDSEGPGRG